MTLDWLEPAVDFRAWLRAAREIEHAGDRFAALAALSRLRLGYVETLQLDQALSAAGSPDVPGFTPLRMALLGSATTEHLLPFVRIAALRRGVRLHVHKGGYGQYARELREPDPALREFRPELVVLAIAARDLVGDVALAATHADAEAALGSAIAGLRALWQSARMLGAELVQQTVLDTSDPLFGSHDSAVPGAPSRLVAGLNMRLAEAAAADRVALVDVARQAARDGLDAWFDIGRWLQARMEIAPPAAAGYGELLARVVAALRGRSRKCLVLDLDNTLWGGVVGDVGAEGIVLGEGSAAGEAHLALQRYAKQLAERGVILAVCSKNDPAIAEATFRDHPEMALRRSDIAAFVANWDDKATNLRRIAGQLNIGLDSLVFVDDNPAERAWVRERLAEVAVPELPDDPAGYVRRIADAGYFESVAFTDDDRQRAGQYAANAERDALRGAAQGMDGFLAGLGMAVDHGPVLPVDVARVAQLLNKTNQFNTTTRRYAADEVAAIAADPDCVALRFRLLDRFGDNGIVSAMLLRRAAADPHVFEIENWVMSCRVFGRELEVEALNVAVEAARSRGARALHALYLPTERNGVIRDLFGTLGFTALPAPELPAGAGRFCLTLAAHTARATHIRRLEATT